MQDIMQYKQFEERKISRFGVGTKRMPITDKSRVDRLDREMATEIFDAARAKGINFTDTSYSNHKGEAEAFIGEYNEASEDGSFIVDTGYFEMIDPRFDYVLDKQLKKLHADKVDFYYIEGVNDPNWEVDIKSGAVDYFFEQKEAGRIGKLGFSSSLSAEKLPDYLSRYPWDFVRLSVNFYDWFNKGLADQYQAITEAGVPILAHSPLKTGGRQIKRETVAAMREANKERTSVEWGLLFAKSLDNVVTVTCNMYSAKQVEENAAVFEDDTVLSADELEVLKKCAEIQKAIRK